MLVCISTALNAQEPEQEEEDIIISKEERVFLGRRDALRPAKAAFYSAVLPGLGQAYNKDYWKIPIVYGALGTGVYFIIQNDNEFQRYRTALRNRISGRPDEFSIINPETGETIETFSQDGLIDAQDFFRKQRDLAILLTVGTYLLQILEANVDAHLSQFSISDDLTLGPNIYIDDIQRGQVNYGVKLSYRLGQ